MKKVLALFFSLFGLIMVAFSLCNSLTPAHADTGPKPDMQITITNLEESDYIIAYGMKYEQYYGPHKAFVPGDEEFGETHFGNADDLTLIYNNVELPEGWYLCDISSSYKNTTELEIHSVYYWPQDFILIIYNELSNKYYLTEETKSYAFHSYFSFDMSGYTDGLISLDKKIELVKSYNYTKEILEFFARLLLTLTIEILLAILFKFDKKSLLIILITNSITQIGLNVSLNLVAHFSGKSLWFVIPYILLYSSTEYFNAVLFNVAKL